jgi:hypothetical protein
MIARISKRFLDKAFQDMCLDESHSFQDAEDFESFLVEKVTDFMNCLLGYGEESKTLWNLIHANASHYFRVVIEGKERMCKGQFIVSLAYHCMIQIDWKLV